MRFYNGCDAVAFLYFIVPWIGLHDEQSRMRAS